MSDYPETREDWWRLVDENWDDLKNLIETFHPSKKNAPKMEITANRAELVRQEICSTIDELGDYESLKNNRDNELLSIFNETYWGMPESVSCHDYPKFYLLCDLCSEGYVLYED